MAIFRPSSYAGRVNEQFLAKKSLGQNFLNSAVVPCWMCDAGEVKAGDTVVEIGPGTGALTREIMARGANVTAIEADHRAIEVLEREFAAEIKAGQLRLAHGDARELDLRTLGLEDHGFKIVANIPYYLTGHLFRICLEAPVQPNTLVFLVQKEVGKRATSSLSRGEKESLLSLSLQAFGEPKYVKTVGKGHFTPAPKVDSAIVLVSNIDRGRLNGLEPKRFFEILHLGFGQKRKQLLGNLSNNYERSLVAAILNDLGLPETVRAEDVSFSKWVSLVERLERP